MQKKTASVGGVSIDLHVESTKDWSQVVNVNSP
jgi:hypothetical protein